jgi:putative MATE family efflux protein
LKNTRLATEPIVSLLIKLSIPAMISMIIQALYNIVDSIFVARLSKEALAAVSLAFPLQMMIISLGIGTGVGVTSLISRLLGQNEKEKGILVAKNALLLSFVYGLITTITGVFFSKQIMLLLSDDMQLVNLSSSYIRIILIGSVAIYIPMISNNILRGEGNTFIPMITMLIGSISNIILDPLLIFGIGFFPRLGVEGAALATIISRIINGIFILFILFKGDNQIKIRFDNMKFKMSILKDIYVVAIPAIAIQMLASIMMLGYNLIISSYGAVVISVMGIYFRLQSFVLMPVFGLAQGYMPILGYNYGSRNINRMKQTIKVGLIIGFILTFLGFLLFFLLPDKLIMLFDKELVEIGTDALKKISFTYIIVGISIVGSTTFQALGKGIPSLILSILRQIVLLIPIAYIFNELWGLDMIWYSIPVSEFIAFVVTILWLRRFLNKTYNEIEYYNGS